MDWSCWASELIVDRLEIIKTLYEFLMNNRLNKLTDSLASQLNYRSRRQGKPTKHKKQQGSPLLKQQPKVPLLIASRISSRPSTPCFNSQDNSILWQDDEDEYEAKQILIVDPPLSSDILIDEGQDDVQLQTKIEEIYQNSRLLEEQRREESVRKEQSQRSSPIYILEEEEDNEDLLWIHNKEQFSSESANSSPNKGEIRIEQSEQQEESFVLQQQSKLKPLEEIKQISAFEEDDGADSSQNILTTSRIPISPQTIAPFFHLQQVQHDINQLQQQHWITQQQIDNNTIEYLSSEQSPERHKSRSVPNQSPQKRNLLPWIDQIGIAQALKRTQNKPFCLSLRKTKELKQQLLPKKLNSLHEMKFLIENESNFVKQRLREQRGTIKVFKHLSKLRIKMPENWKGYQYSTLSDDQQIEMNKMLIRVMTNNLKQ